MTLFDAPSCASGSDFAPASDQLPTDLRPTTPRRCICCGVGERWRPGGWKDGWFRPDQSRPIHGPLCGFCAGRLDQTFNAPKGGGV